MARNLTKSQEIERSLLTKYRKDIWSPFILAIKKYNLIEAGDKIAVCISGGKDSMILAKLMQQLQKISDVPFEVVFLSMNPGYNAKNLKQIEDNARIMEIPIQFFDSNIFDVTAKEEKNPCYLCARMRRGFLYSRAQELGCNKIALGHHKSDVIETTLMSILYSGQIQGMLPKVKSTNFAGMELIRPLYCVLEKDILRWVKANDLKFIACACRLTEATEEEDGGMVSARKETKLLIEELSKKIPQLEDHIFESTHNVQLDTMVEFKHNDKRYNFLDNFSEKIFDKK